MGGEGGQPLPAQGSQRVYFWWAQTLPDLPWQATHTVSISSRVVRRTTATNGMDDVIDRLDAEGVVDEDVN